MGLAGTGPSFKGLWDRTKSGTTAFTNGTTMSQLMQPGGEFEIPENYIRTSLVQPQKQVVQGYAGAMPSFQGQLKERQIDALVLMIKNLDSLVGTVVDDQGNILENPDLGDETSEEGTTDDNG